MAKKTKKDNDQLYLRRQIEPTVPIGNANANLNLDVYEWQNIISFNERRLYLYGGISTSDQDLDAAADVAGIVDSILRYNRLDRDIPPKERAPVLLYINSPGGDIVHGFSLISTIEQSKTPIYTVNIGQWCSMSFYIGIAGHRRYSLPNMTFLMHDGEQLTFDSISKVRDQVEFTERFEKEVIKKHVKKHSKMSGAKFDKLRRVEFFMLPEDALEYGFIDEIVTDIDTIL